MCDPVLDFRSLHVGEETQHSFIWFRHNVDGVVESPINLPLGQEQLCPVTVAVKCLGRVTCQFGSSSCLSESRTSCTSRWSTTTATAATTTATTTATARS